jgi:hypothetical protein
MGLKAVLEKADYDKLEDAIKKLYVETDGKFVLDADVEDHPKVGGLKSALEKERKAKGDADKEFKKLKDQIGDLDPEKAREALKRVQEMADRKLLDEGKVDELIKLRTDAMQKAHDGQVTALKTQITERDTKLGTVTGRFRQLVLGGSIRDEAVRAGVKKEHIDDVQYRLTQRGVKGVRWDLQDDEAAENGVTIVAMEGSNVKYGKDATKTMTLGEGLELLREEVPGFFEPSNGGGARNSGARQIGNAMVISSIDAKDTQKYRNAKVSAEKAGVELQIRD